MASYKYFAFISYNSKDTEWGKKLQRKLEHYRMPATLCSEHNWNSRTPIKPVFFAPTDIQPGGLSDELKHRLESSENLIVICSPYSAKSEWVGKEIAYFYGLGRPKNIHFFIVDGMPHSGNEDTECFNPILKELDLPEILGANIHEKIFRWPWLNRERAYIQLITKLLNIDFDTLWNRHRRILIQELIAWAIGIIFVIAAIICSFLFSQPVNVEMTLKEITPENRNLPQLKDATITVFFGNYELTDTINSFSDVATFRNIRKDMLGNNVKVTFRGEGYINLDTTLNLSQKVLLNVLRDSSYYGNVQFNLCNEHAVPLPHKSVALNGIPAKSDEKGFVMLSIPITKQAQKYQVTSSEVTIITPVLEMPCTNCATIIAK